jgi:putative pyruvate formate lyase activating enzyme
LGKRGWRDEERTRNARISFRTKFKTLWRSGELQTRVEQLEQLLARCTVCPKDCGNNRLKDEIAACYSGRLPIVSSYTPHFGEEPALSGTRGAGNIFFGNCNLRCVYCQNFKSRKRGKRRKKTKRRASGSPK